MNNSIRRTFTSLFVRTVFAILAAFLVFGMATSAMAQGSTDGSTPAGLAPGSPTGSYPLSDFDVVNLYNGGLNFRMPLYQVGGRGSAGYPITLHVQKKWTVYKHLEPGVGAFYFADAGWWSEEGASLKIFEAGKVDIRSARRQQSFSVVETLTRITFTAPDGTEYELRDQATNGQPVSPVSGGFNRGTIFVTADGTTATFISDWDIHDDPTYGQGFYDDRPDGYMMLKDGTRFRVDDGKISWMTDRNGNKVSFGYDPFRRVTSITDSLNRQVTISYPSTTTGFTTISYKGFGGAARTIKIGQTNLANALRSGYTMQTAAQLFPELHGGGPIDSTVINYIELPDGRTYQLLYNPYAELARVVLPTGGAIEYDYAAGLTDGAASGVFTGSTNKHVYRRIIERRIYPDGGSGSGYESKITYTRPETTTSNLGYVVTETRNASGTLLAKSQHYFYGSPKASFNQEPTHYGAWKDGREYKTEIFDVNGSTVLKRVEQSFEQRDTVAWWGGTSDTAPPNDPRTIETVTTIEPATASLVSKQVFDFDDSVPFNNQNSVKEYGFGTGTAGSLVRETRTTFVTSSTYTSNSVHLRGLPSQTTVLDGSAIEKAKTVYEYDNYATDSNHVALTSRSNISGLDSTFSTSYTTRGNITGITQHFMVAGSSTGSISNYSQYDIAGNVVKKIDARGSAVTLIYTDCFGAPNGEAQTSTDPTELGSTTKTFAFVTEVRNALNQSTFAQFDFYLGQPVDGKDVNGVVASGYFNDSLDRPTEVRRAVGTSLENRSVFSYDDTNRVNTTTADRDTNNDGILVTKLLYDQMGRTIETRRYEGGTNYIATQTQYDALGRAYKTSNPFRPWQSETAVWTTQAFDAQGRVISVTTPDNAAVTTSHSGNSITVSDQTGKQRKSVTDALGRLIEVYEAPNDTVNYNFLTTYAYDTLDNLTGVTQGAQTRSFVYDSLNRLTSTINPESGTTTYQYDANGNVLVKTDARKDPNNVNKKVSAHAEYDVLNRVTRRWYNGSSSVSDTLHNNPSLPPGVEASDEVRFYYDSQPSIGGPTYTPGAIVGRLVAQTYGGVANGDYFAYDSLGRPTQKYQKMGTKDYRITATYNLSGGITGMEYPSGNTIANSYDQAGRLTTFSGNLGEGGTARTYSNEIIYSSFGSLAKEKFGTTTPIYNKLFYNVRAQLAEIRTSTSYTGPTDYDANRGGIINHYSAQCSGICSGSNMTDNNGNLKKQELIIPGESTNRVQEYAYDSLNRLTSATEKISTTTQWNQTFTYDRWGNRTITSANGADVSNRGFTINTANNRYGVPSGQSGVMEYDDAGNLTNDTYTGGGLRKYDAANKMTYAIGQNAQAQTYGYDSSGQRIKRTVNGVETWQIYGLGGELVAEYAADGATSSPQKEYGYRNGELLIAATAATGGDRSLSVNGTNSYALVPNSTSLNVTGAITVEAWVKPNSFGVYQSVISRETYGVSGTGGGYELQMNNLGRMRLDLYHTHNTYTPVIGNTTLNLGQWNHVAGVWDGAYMRLYINGVLDATITSGNAPGSGNSSVKLGRNSGGNYFNGSIDEVRVSNAALYSSNFTPQQHLTASGSTKGLWKFDGQNVNDTSGNANNGSLQSGATYSTDVPTGPAYHSLSVNGTTGYVSVPNSTSLNITGAITVEVWVKPTSFGGYQSVLSRETFGVSGTGGGYEMQMNPLGKMRLDLYHTYNTYTPVIGNTPLNLGQWNHVAGVWDGAYMRLYVNGVLDATITSGNAPGSGTSSLKLGRNSGGNYFNGLIDEVRVSNSAVYSSNFTPSQHLTASGSTMALWKFDGQTPNDSSTNGNNGTLQSGSSYSNDVPSGDGAGGSSGATAAQTQWLVSDQLGTPRIIFDQTGDPANTRRNDYAPFGEELLTVGGRASLAAYTVSDGVRQQFTGYERDVETDLNYAINRYYSSQSGRFTSPDPYTIILEKDQGRDESERRQRLLNYCLQPQIWNKYAYSLNNPIKYSDPDGRRAITAEDERKLQKLADAYEAAMNINDTELANAISAAINEIAYAIDAVPEGQEDPSNLKTALYAIDRLGDRRFAAGPNGSDVSFQSNGWTISLNQADQKCNFFVAMSWALGGGIGLNGDGNTKGVPVYGTKGGLGKLWGNGYVPGANEWAGGRVGNFSVVGSPQIGDVAGWGSPIGQGHSAIYVGGGAVVYAQSNDGVKVQSVNFVNNNKNVQATYNRYKP